MPRWLLPVVAGVLLLEAILGAALIWIVVGLIGIALVLVAEQH